MIRLGGDVTDASTHFAQIGLAAILNDAGIDAVRLFWENGPSARAVVTWEGDADVGQIVKDHASRCCQKDSWVSQSEVVQTPRGEMRLGWFSPRITAATTTEESSEWVGRRRHKLDDLSLKPIDRAMIGALGEPAYWRRSAGATGKCEPDHGATRWDMVARWRGDNFVPHGLYKYAGFVSKRSSQLVGDGLSGSSLVDEADDDSKEKLHMTPLGFRNRSLMDNATAWCMLWGISATTLVPRPKSDTASKGFSQTSGVHPRNRTHPSHVTLPVFQTPTSLTRWSAVLRSKVWDGVVAALDLSIFPAAMAAEVSKLGIHHAVRFATEVVESEGAPEPRLKGGVLVRINDAE